jgi:hypothetical protein
MTRPRDEHGRLAAQAHKRLAEAPVLEMAAVMAISADRRFAFLDLKRRLALGRKAIHHVVDGDVPPPAVFKKDASRGGETVMVDAWNAAVGAVKSAWRGEG